MLSPGPLYMTRRGVFYDLSESCFNITVNGFVLFFSSIYNLRRFKSKISDNRNFINTSLSKRFNFCIKLDEIAMIKTYTLIEKRGFLIYNSITGEWYTCLSEIKLNGGNLIKNCSHKGSECSTLKEQN